LLPDSMLLISLRLFTKQNNASREKKEGGVLLPLK
jgi:hypothetical protein